MIATQNISPGLHGGYSIELNEGSLRNADVSIFMVADMFLDLSTISCGPSRSEIYPAYSESEVSDSHDEL